MKKTTKTILIVIGVAAAGYLIYAYFQNKSSLQSQGGNIPTGTNLNSVAPNLVGGSTGPSVGPAVSLPVNITLTEQATPNSRMPEQEGNRQHGGRRHPHHHVQHGHGRPPEWFGPIPNGKNPGVKGGYQLGLTERAG